MMYLLSTSCTLSDMFIINFLSIFVIMVVCWTYADAQQITIKADKDSVPKDGRLVLTCSMQNLKIPVAWILNDASNNHFIGYYNNICEKSPDPFLAPYMGDCVNSTVYTLTIDPVSSSMSGDTWRCAANDNSSISFRSNEITIQVTVPMTNVAMITPTTSSITVNEGLTEQFVCTTSSGLPAASVRWYKDSRSPANTGDDLEISSSISVNYLNNIGDKTVATTSTLSYTANKTDNGMAVYCTASNGVEDLVSSKKPILNVQFAPDSNPVIQGFRSSASYYMIRNSVTTQQLTCTLTGGNPLAVLSWSCYGGSHTGSSQGNTVTRTVSWIAGTRANSACTCTASHVVGWTRSTSVNVSVLYPPSAPQCSVGTSTVYSGTIQVICGSTLTISCTSSGNPAPEFNWTIPNVGTRFGEQLTVINVQTEVTYSLTVTNTMTPSLGQPEPGSSSTDFSTEILYPPSSPVFYLGGTTGHRITGNILSVIRGKSTSVACISTGNPDPTYSSWNGTGQLWTFTANTDTTRMCVASNTLDPTGFINEPRLTSGALNIKVMYGASIKHFDILGHEGRDEVVLFESSRVSFHCAVDSNPDSFIEILKDGQSLKKVSSAQDLNFVIEESKCEDDGIYTCTGRNVHDSSPVIRALTVFVKCSPRASTVSPSVHYVTSVTGNTATLTFTLVAYPRPHISDFQWEKKYMPGNGWTIMHSTHSVDIFISANRLQTSIAFTSVQEVDFGYYRVNVSNELGRTSEIFHLQLQEPGPSAGPAIGGAVGGSIGLIAVIVMIVVILRRNSTLNCNIVGKKDVPPGKSVSGANNPGHNAETHEEISMTTGVLVYDVLDRGEIGPDSTHVYMPLEESSLKSNINYGNLKTE